MASTIAVQEEVSRKTIEERALRGRKDLDNFVVVESKALRPGLCTEVFEGLRRKVEVQC